jgi:hypothetical protein
LADVGVELEIELVNGIFEIVSLVKTYSAARGRGGCLAEEARDSRTAGRCTGVGCGGNTRVCTVRGHWHHARATREVVAGGGSNL